MSLYIVIGDSTFNILTYFIAEGNNSSINETSKKLMKTPKNHSVTVVLEYLMMCFISLPQCFNFELVSGIEWHYRVDKTHSTNFIYQTWNWNKHLSCNMTKPTKWHVCPAKTQISLGIRPVWSEYSMCAQWVAKDKCFLHADSEDSDQTGRMPRLIWVFARRTCYVVGFVMRRLI